MPKGTCCQAKQPELEYQDPYGVERENQFHWVVFCSSRIYMHVHANTLTYPHKINTNQMQWIHFKLWLNSMSICNCLKSCLLIKRHNYTQGLAEKIRVKWFLFMDWLPTSFCVVVTRSMKGNPRLILEEIRTEYAGDSTAMSKRTGGSRKRSINPLIGWNKLGAGNRLYTLTSWVSSSSFFGAVWSMADEHLLRIPILVW